MPAPPLGFAAAIAQYASASMDVSDGLVGDAAKLAAASKVALRIEASAVPLSAAGRASAEAGGAPALTALLTGGDDYQALFTAPAEAGAAIRAAAREADVRVSMIGAVLEGQGVSVADAEGAELPCGSGAFSHRLGA
jgi:thiamine-monophosphate kinase